MKLSILFLSICALGFGKYVPKLDGRIVGGVETTIEEFPFQVSVRYNGEHTCGGSILNENTILTACHCVHMLNLKSFSVRVGNTVHYKGEEHEVEKVIEHSYYNKEAPYDNDVALLKLATPLVFNERIQPIELQSENADDQVGEDGIVTGWGDTYENENGIQDVLRKVEVRLIANEHCEKVYGPDLTIHMLCAQSPLHDSCQGDSGGPLVVDGKLIGLVSWGIGCARPQYPGVYANVPSLHDWIVDHI